MKADLERYGYKGLEPKPEMDLTWYKGDDRYSEGSIEDEIIRLLVEHEGEDYSKVINNHSSWSTFYHLSPTRQNIINWYPFKQNSDVLEIGCGMGAITELLCNKCRSVTAVELSKKRATATLLRCKEKENLNIIVGNLNDIEFGQKFDYITLIGVLEYQKTYTDSKHPFVDFLKKVKSLLKPEGKLLVAIENKYGLKYWCGAGEDHSAVPFDGINQYRLVSGEAQTFSKEELKKILVQSGFEHTYFYYPLPDYKLPTVIYSENHLPIWDNLENMVPYYGARAGYTLVADEMAIYKDLIENGVFEFFANSFLVECAAEQQELGEVRFVLNNTSRLPEYRVVTKFCGEAVIKESLTEHIGHISETHKNLMELKQRGLHVVACEQKGKGLISPYVKLPLGVDSFIDAYERWDIDKIFKLWDAIFEEIKHSSEEESTTSILEDLRIVEKLNLPKGDKLLKKGYIDMVCRNCFVDGNAFIWFDQEWSLPKVPASYVLFCNIWELYSSYSWMEQVVSWDTILEHYGVLHCKAAYRRLRVFFQKSVSDIDYVVAYARYAQVNKNTIIENINALLSKNRVD